MAVFLFVVFCVVFLLVVLVAFVLTSLWEIVTSPAFWAVTGIIVAYFGIRKIYYKIKGIRRREQVSDLDKMLKEISLLMHEDSENNKREGNECERNAGIPGGK